MQKPFSEYGVGVVFLPANGGKRELLVAEDDQYLLRHPHFLRGGQGVLFSKTRSGDA